MPSLDTIFRDMPDPRRGNARRHDLLDILTIALVASVCGAESCVDFAEFARDREPLRKHPPRAVFAGRVNGRKAWLYVMPFRFHPDRTLRGRGCWLSSALV